MEKAIYEVVCLRGKERYTIGPIILSEPKVEDAIKEAREYGEFKEGDIIVAVNALYEGGGISATAEVMGLLIDVDTLQEAARDALDVPHEPGENELLKATDLVNILIEKADLAKKLLDALVEDVECGENVATEKPVLRLVEKKQ